MALGQLGLLFDYYYSLTPRQFFNTLNGRRKMEDAASKERWVLARKVAYFSVIGHLKNQVSEQEFMPFPWEEKMMKEMSEKEKEALLEQTEKSKQFWEEYDKKKNLE